MIILYWCWRENKIFFNYLLRGYMMKKLITIRHFLNQNGMKQTELAQLIGVSQTMVNKYVRYNTPCSPETHDKLIALGIDHPKGKVSYNNRQHLLNLGRPSKFSKNIVKYKVKSNDSFSEDEIKSDILKNFQIECLKKYGNTIISNSFNDIDVINEYSRFGLKVSLHNFSSFHYGLKDTHKVVRLIE